MAPPVARMPVSSRTDGSGGAASAGRALWRLTGRRAAVGDLLGLAIADPGPAEARGERLLASETDPWALSVARHARGDRAARPRLPRRRAVGAPAGASSGASDRGDGDRRPTSAPRSGWPSPWPGGPGPVSTSSAGRWRRPPTPPSPAKILMRRGHVTYFVLAHPQEALADLEPALRGFRSAGDRVWEARTLNLMGLCHLALGAGRRRGGARQRGRAHLLERRASASSRSSPCTTVGGSPTAKGDLPLALRLYDEAAERYAAARAWTRRASSATSATRCWRPAWPTRRSTWCPTRMDRVASRPSTGPSSCSTLAMPSSPTTSRPPRRERDRARGRCSDSQRRDRWAAWTPSCVVLLAPPPSRTGRSPPSSTRRRRGGAAGGRGSDDAAGAWLLAAGPPWPPTPSAGDRAARPRAATTGTRPPAWSGDAGGTRAPWRHEPQGDAARGADRLPARARRRSTSTGPAWAAPS